MHYSPRQQQKSLQQTQKKQWWKLIIWAIVLCLFYFAWSSYSYSSDIKSTVSEIENFSYFTIESGDVPKKISKKLEEQNFIVSSASFIKYLTENNLDVKLYNGRYSLSPHLTIPEIVEILTTPAEFISITIPEGLTLAEIDKRMSDKGYFKEGEFLKCITSECSFPSFSFLPLKRSDYEGYFFPATYSIKDSELSPKTLAQQMLSAFQQRIIKHNLDSDEKRSREDIVIMASLIEKESSSHEGDESAMISGILWNRIDRKIPLGVDASTRYALQKDSSALTKTDLNHEGEFNTRKHKGLPPHAISNAGDASLNAARNPKKTDYLFYLHDKNGIIHYAKTNAEHEKNKRIFCGSSCE